MRATVEQTYAFVLQGAGHRRGLLSLHWLLSLGGRSRCPNTGTEVYVSRGGRCQYKTLQGFQRAPVARP